MRITTGKYAGHLGTVESNVHQRTVDCPEDLHNGFHVRLDTEELVTRWYQWEETVSAPEVMSPPDQEYPTTAATPLAATLTKRPKAKIRSVPMRRWPAPLKKRNASSNKARGAPRTRGATWNKAGIEGVLQLITALWTYTNTYTYAVFSIKK